MNKVENIVEDILYMKMTCDTDSETFVTVLRVWKFETGRYWIVYEILFCSKNFTKLYLS